MKKQREEKLPAIGFTTSIEINLGRINLRFIIKAFYAWVTRRELILGDRDTQPITMEDILNEFDQAIEDKNLPDNIDKD